MLDSPRPTETPSRRRRAVVPAVVAAAGIAVGSAAWACVPEPDDTRTMVQSCAAPAGKVCKTPVGQAPFPNATFVKGAAGSTVVAFVNGPGMQPGMAYDLLFIGKPLVTSGTLCASSAATVISTGVGVIGTTSEGINPTAGLIPAGSALGGGQICFADKARSISSSNVAIFKVVV